ncbi:endonuclease [Lacinutrix gracilariae]|uniref:Endonuclease n=1 Tax=Lacinutrix gracilariae TaxID=1747198 RepID=A0ABW5JX99_9FLAO
MKKQFSLLVLLFVCQFTFSQIVINELDCDTPSTDDKEFVELKSDTPYFSLDGYVLVFFNGSSSGGDSSYFTVALDGYQTDINGLLVIGSDTLAPFPQLLISANTIQNGADAVAIYSGSESDFPEGTLATQTNLIDALVYDTSDSDDSVLMSLLGVTEQINEGSSNNTNSIQRLQDGSYVSTTPTPREVNDGVGESFIAISMATDQDQYNEGESFDIVFSTEENVTEDITFSFTLDNYGFNASDFSGDTTVTIPNGFNSVSTTITLINDTVDEGDEELIIKYENLNWPYIANNNFLKLRVNDDDFTVAPFGTPLNPTYGIVQSTQPAGYYDSLDGLADAELHQALQDIIADPSIVRAQTYADVIDILKEADQNPANSNQVWLLYTEQGRAKLDYQLTSDSNGKWNREHTYPRSRGGFYSIEEDEIADGVDVFWTTKADSLRHGNSDAHALRAVDGPENSSRNNKNYGDPILGGYNGPENTLGSFYGDVARSVLYMEIRFNGLQVVNGFSEDTTGELGDLATLLEWHRNDPPDDFEMNRNNVVYNWQFNRNPFIDQPDLVEYIWGNMQGQAWDQELSAAENTTLQVEVYPNPATNMVYVNGLLSPAKVEVFSVEGRKVKTYPINGNTVLNVNLSTGMYLFKITSEDKATVKKIFIN